MMRNPFRDPAAAIRTDSSIQTATTTSSASASSPSSSSDRSVTHFTIQNIDNSASMNKKKIPTLSLQRLWRLLTETPSHQATPKQLTQEILTQIRTLEKQCPTDSTQVVEKLAGTWELVWTAQDDASPEANRGLLSWIGPLEDQSYSNNALEAASSWRRSTRGGGRANPVLPRPIQDALEASGILGNNHKQGSPGGATTTKGSSAAAPVSTQSIDLTKNLITNGVSLRVLDNVSVSLAVKIALFHSNTQHDPRRIDVRFVNCRVSIPSWKVNWVIPLGLIQGWLRTTYIDDTVRITRGHKGSVFVLKRRLAGTRG